MAHSSTKGENPGRRLQSGLAETHKAHNRLTVRLIVAVPALFALIVIGYGSTILTVIFHFAPEDNWSATAIWALGALLVFSLVAVACGVGLAFSILSPLRAISQALERVAHGALETYTQVGGGPELEAVGESFNSMIQYLNQVFKERNRFLLETDRPGMLTLDRDGRFSGFNPEAENILGLNAPDLLGKRLDALPQSLWANPACGPFFQRLQEAVHAETPFHSETVALGGAPGGRRLSVSLSLERSPDGLLKAYAFSFRDVSQGEAMRRLLARTDQLAAMGAFSMGLAHELRNPLGSIKGMAQLLEEEPSKGETERTFARQIVREVDRLDSFIRELLEFGQEAPEPAVPCDLAELAAEALQLARSGVQDIDAKNLRIEKKLSPLSPILLQRGRIVRALANLVGNALEAAPQGAMIRLVARCEGAGLLRRAVAEVHNQGPPIPDEDRERIFEPFYTTKPGGTGLGLAIAYQIVAQNGGELNVRCANGWTRFAMSFPLPLDMNSALGL